MLYSPNWIPDPEKLAQGEECKLVHNYYQMKKMHLILC